MLNESDLTEGQQDAVTRLVEYNRTLVVAEMGFGKSVVTLTAINELLSEGVLSRVLVVAPLRVMSSVWGGECAKWEHLAGLRVGLVTGNVEARERALAGDCHILVTNFEQLPWLFRESSRRGRGMFDGLVIDEISKLKKSGGKQFKALRGALSEFTWRVGLTGTPVSEDWQGLYGQMLIIDDGAALGTRVDVFLRRYFYPEDWNEYSWLLHDWAASVIAARVRGCVFVAEKYSDGLPDLITDIVSVEMCERAQVAYSALRGCGVWVSDEGVEIAADTAAVASGKLEQVCNGFLYAKENTSDVIQFSDPKLKAVKGLVDKARGAARGTARGTARGGARGGVRGGGGVVVCYWYHHDLTMLRNEFEDAVVLSEYKSIALDNVVGRWNQGDIGVLLVHPRSCGHGLNLANGGARMVWYSLPWSRDLYLQTMSRLYRRGQREVVRVSIVEVADSIDVIKRLRVEGKQEWERLFNEHIVSK